MTIEEQIKEKQEQYKTILSEIQELRKQLHHKYDNYLNTYVKLKYVNRVCYMYITEVKCDYFKGICIDYTDDDIVISTLSYMDIYQYTQITPITKIEWDKALQEAVDKITLKIKYNG